jgi:hypothetical protein
MSRRVEKERAQPSSLNYVEDFQFEGDLAAKLSPLYSCFSEKAQESVSKSSKCTVEVTAFRAFRWLGTMRFGGQNWRARIRAHEILTA